MSLLTPRIELAATVQRSEYLQGLTTDLDIPRHEMDITDGCVFNIQEFGDTKAYFYWFHSNPEYRQVRVSLRRPIPGEDEPETEEYVINENDFYGPL